MDDAYRIEAQALAQLGIQTHFEFEKPGPASGNATPLLAVLAACRNDAIQALGALAEADPNNPAVIIKLQSMIHMYRSMVDHTKGIMEMADEAIKELAPEDADEVRRAVGLLDQPEDD